MSNSVPGRFPSPRAWLALAVGLLALGSPVRAQVPSGQQQLPSPAQAEEMLKNQPELVDQLRQRLQQSGLTPDQVRARLRAAGYPDSMLDQFLQGADTTQAPSFGPRTLDAVKALGVLSEREADSLQMTDSLRQMSDSLRNLIDSLRMMKADSLRADSLADSVRVLQRGGLKRFGLETFRRTSTRFQPNQAGPVDLNYRLGSGDVVVLILTGDVERAYTLDVTREGFVVIPQVGQVYVANLTLGQLEEQLYARLGKVYSGVRKGPAARTRFQLSLAKLRNIQIYVTGDVVRPGAFQMSSAGTVLSALYAAGGPTESGSFRRVDVRRGGKLVDSVDLYDYLMHGINRTDIRLETGDVVFVPEHGQRARVIGAVSRPAIYAIKPGETLADLLRAAGGFRPDAALQRVTIFRYLPAAERRQPPLARGAVDVALAPAGAGDASVGDVAVPSVGLEDGDSVVVDSLPPLSAQYTVGIAGMVNKPGMFPWHPGMTLRELMLLARGPRIGAYLKEAEVARLPVDRSAGQLATTVRVSLDSSYLIDRDSVGRYIGPPGLPFPASGTAEVLLEPFDNVLILRQPDFDYQRTVSVSGEVRYPGVYSLQTKNDRLAEVIARAGGLTPQAYADGIRFIRTQNDVGRINVDLTRALRETSSSANLVLQPGDSIYLPEYQPSVKVSGAVNSPGSVLWRRGSDLNYYLSAAGGFAQRADKGAVSVRFANGEVRTRGRGLFRGDPKPGPGSEVFVPAEDPTAHKTDYVALFAAIAQILASAVTIAVVATK